MERTGPRLRPIRKLTGRRKNPTNGAGIRKAPLVVVIHQALGLLLSMTVEAIKDAIAGLPDLRMTAIPWPLGSTILTMTAGTGKW